jgi:hypothetical protein
MKENNQSPVHTADSLDNLLIIKRFFILFYCIAFMLQMHPNRVSVSILQTVAKH